MTQKQREDMEAFIKNHSYAVAYANQPYDLLSDETEIINLILRKVVLMRELPLITASKNLAFAKDYQLIDKQSKRLKGLQSKSMRSQYQLKQMQQLSLQDLKP